MRRILLSLSFLLLFPVAIPFVVPAPATAQEFEAPSVSPRCEAKMDRVAGRYASCLLKAKARAARDQEQDVEETREAEAECREDFEKAVDRALARHQEENCTPFVTQMEERTSSYAEAMALEAAGVPALELLFVQSADGGELTGSTLTLSGVSDQTGWFSDRPFRFAGQVPTEEFISLWDEGESAWADDPPNADFTCTVDSEVVNYVVELTSPSMTGDDLTYSVTALEDTVLPDTMIACEGDSNLFIDAVDCSNANILMIFCVLFNGGSIF